MPALSLTKTRWLSWLNTASATTPPGLRNAREGVSRTALMISRPRPNEMAVTQLPSGLKRASVARPLSVTTGRSSAPLAPSRISTVLSAVTMTNRLVSK